MLFKRRKRGAEAIREAFDEELTQFTESFSRGDEERNRLEAERL